MTALTFCVLIIAYFLSLIKCEVSRYIQDDLSIAHFVSFSDTSGSQILEFARKNFRKIINTTINSDQISLSDKCKNIIARSYLNSNYTNLFVNKLVQDSSINKNDVGSYNDCLNLKYRLASPVNVGIIKNFTYLVITVELQGHNHSNLNSTQYEANWFIFGLCVAKGCTISEYKQVIYSMNFGLNNIFDLTSMDQLDLYNMDDHRSREFKAEYIIFLFPFFIMIIQILFVFFPRIPTHIFKFCFRAKLKNKLKFLSSDISSGGDLATEGKRIPLESNITSDFTPEKPAINKKDLFKFKSSFNLTENGEELFNVKSSVSNFNNESGLTYIKGIRGVSMFFLVFGQLFFNLYEAPIKIYGESSFIQLIKNYLYGILFYGLRFSPRILFSCSGFCLVYKLLCFLDDRLEVEVDSKLEKMPGKKPGENENSSTMRQMNCNDQMLDSSSLLIERDPDEISYCGICKFYMYQVHKYMLLILTVCFVQYSFYYLILLITEVGPIWVYFKLHFMENSSFLDLLGHVFLIFNFDIPGEKSNCLLNIFWMVFNEVFFFIFTGLLIFLCYKKKIKLDIIILALILTLQATRILLVLLTPTWYSTLYYYYFDYGGLFINPLNNYPYYLLGIFFGLMNYAVQKGITFREAIKQEKPYLILPIAIVNLFKARSKCCVYVLGSAGILLQVICSIIQPLFLSLAPEKDKNLNYFYVNRVINVFYLIDIDIVVLVFHLSSFGFFLKGENIVNKFLSNNFWIIFNRLYFGYILLINPVILYIFYQSETRIKLELFNVFFYSLIAGFILLFTSSIFFIFFELPFKRIVKLVANRTNVEEKCNRAAKEDNYTRTQDLVSNTY